MAGKPPEPANLPGPAGEPDFDEDLDPDNGLEFDDDLDLDDRYHGDPNRLTMGMRLWVVLLLLFVAALVVYLIVLVIYPREFARESWIGAGAPPEIAAKAKKRETPVFELGGVELGMTPAQVIAVYPDVRFRPAVDADQIGVFPHHDGEYLVSFYGPERGERAYRIRSEHSFAKISYLELLSDLSGRYGKPSDADCGADKEAIAMQCQLHWEKVNVVIDARIRTAIPKGGQDARTTLTVTATDIRPDSAFAGFDAGDGKTQSK